MFHNKISNALGIFPFLKFPEAKPTLVLKIFLSEHKVCLFFYAKNGKNWVKPCK